MIEPSDIEPRERVTRVVNMAIPLPWLLSTAVAIVWALVTTYFTVNQLVRTVEDLQITVRSGNTAVVTLQSEQAVMRIRFENLESTVKRIQEGRK